MSCDELSALEKKLLRYLVENRGHVLSREELLEKVWNYNSAAVTRTIDVHIASLRHKLQRPDLILTVRGRGYMFVGEDVLSFGPVAGPQLIGSVK